MAAAEDAPAEQQPARPAYWDAPMGEGAPAPQHDDAASMGRQSVAGPDAEQEAPRPAYWDAPLAAAPEPEAKPTEAPKPAESTFGTDVLTGIGARGAQMYHGAKEAMANHQFSSAREEFYRTMVLGDAVRDAGKAGIALIDDPVVQEISKHVGMRPDQFVRGWYNYVNLSEEEKQKRLGELQQQMVEATGNIAEASHGRALAGQVSREAMPREHQFAYKALTMAPEILGGLGISMIPGGQAPAAAMFMSDFGLTSYAQARDSGASDDQAKVYGVLSGLAATVPQVPVMTALQKTPAAQALMQTAIGKVLAQNAAGRVAGAVASQATNESLALAVQNTLQIAIDKGVLDQNTTLGEALRTIGEGALMGATFGSFSGAAHSGVNRLVNGPAATQGPGASDAMTNRILEAQHTAMDAAQTDAEQAALAAGGDALDGKVAAIQANAHVSAEHDAATVHQTRVEAARKSAEDEIANAQAAEDELKKDQDFGAAERQAGKVGNAPSADEAFAQREQEGALAAKRAEAQKDRDFVPAKNQAADQDVAQAEVAEEKGGASPAKPTLAEALPTEQVNALQALRDRLAAQRSANEPAKETTAAERLKAQNPEDDFQQLGPEVPKATKGEPKFILDPLDELAPGKAKAPEKAPEPTEDEEEPTGGPPPVTAQTLAERRQQALDAAMAAKVRGPVAKEAPIAAHRRDLTALERDLPAPAEGTTRLWRGGKKGEGPGEQTRFTDDPAGIAMPFEKGYGGRLFHVDVPTDQLEGYRNGPNDPGAFNLPKELAAKAQDSRNLAKDKVAPKGALAERRAAARPPLQQGVDPAERLLEEQVKKDADAAAANPKGKRPPLVQGRDLAGPLIEAKARRDAEAAAAPTTTEEAPAPATAEAPIAAPEAAEKESARIEAERTRPTDALSAAPAKPNRLAAIRAAQEKRNQRIRTPAEQSIIDDLRAGRAKKGEEPPRFADVRQANVWKRMNDELAEHRAAMDKARDAGDVRGYNAAADKYDALHERIMRVAKQQAEAPPERPAPGSKPTGRFAAIKDRAANLKRWFGKSVVKNADGSPKVVYHGTPVWERNGKSLGDVTSFDRNAAGKALNRTPGMDAVGSWFTDSPEGAGDFSGSEGVVYPTHLKIENPWRPTSFDEFLARGRKAAGLPPKGNPMGRFDPQYLRNELKRAGHDGIIFPSMKIDGREQQYHVAFEPEQVKSAVGNSGDFDPANPDIRSKTAEENIAEDMDRATNPRMTKDEATEHLKPVLAKIHPAVAARTHVHGDKNDALALPDSQLSARTKEQLRNYEGTPAGLYDPDTNTVHVFGDGHLASPTDDGRPGGQSEIIKTLAHEYTHMGLRNILGADYRKTMLDLANKVKNRQLAKDLIEARGFDVGSEEHMTALGDEYAAHLAEDANADPGLWRTVVDGVRRALRKVGLVRNWTDDDIRDLVRRNNPMLGETDAAARAGLAYKGDVPRFADNKATDHQIDRDLDPTDPKAIQYKLARTVEEQMDANRGSIDSRTAWDNFVAQAQKTGRNLAEWGRGTNDNKRLGWIGLRNMMDFMRKDLMPDLHGFIDDHDAMDGMRGRLVNEGADIARKWSKWQAKQDDRGWGLSELMHSSTLLGHDASKPYESQYTKEELAESPDKRQDDRYQRALHAGLKKTYDSDALGSEGRELYNTVRDHYATARQRIFDALTRRIEETGADENTKKQLMAELRQRFESGRVKGVYFPLQRFGNRWARAMDAEGNHVAFSRFENKDDQDQWLKHMRDQGLEVDKGQQIDSKSEMERIDPDFVKKVMSLAHDADGSGELEKEIWQTYLKAMPEMSMRKHFIMRQGRLGFSQDALRAFAYNSFHGAHQQARLEYGNRLDTRLANVKKQAEALATVSAQNPGDKLADKNSEWGAALAKELEQRLDWIKNPRSSPWASNLTKFGFLWYLAAAPATALRISLQNTMLAQPQIARHFGQIGATKELSKAVLQWAGARGKLSDKLRGDERAAFERAADMGIFSNTNTTMLASGGEGAPMTGAYDKFQRVAGYLFNAMEHKNRMTTFLATYRLGVKKGMSTDDAFKLARNVTWDSHFDYTNANRPGVLQNDFAKVAGLFRQYAWGVTYRLGRDLRDSFKADSTKEERLSAAHAFSNTMARMMLYAGVTGVGIGFPVYGLISGLTNAIMNQVDPDRPFDMTQALHEHLQDHLGKTAADSIMTGPASQITGAALSRGASYNDMWYKPPDREMKGRDQVMDAMGQFLGPVAAIPINAVTGADMMAQGHFERGLEHFLPPESAALAKSLRYSQEGAKNLKGDTVVDKKELSKWDIAVQGAGFTPQKIAAQNEINTQKQNYIDRVQTRKQALSTNLRAAIVASDDKEEKSVLKQVDHFNTAHPGDAIGWREVQQIRSEARAAALSDRGVREPKGLREEVQRKFK